MKHILSITIIALFVFAYSCQKNETISTPTSTFSTYSSMDTIYKMLEVKPKYVTVNGATGGTFYGTSGTRYVIPPNCLQDAAGNPVTTNVQFEVAEYLKEGDMIFSKMLPISDKRPLLSGGEISIKAFLSGQPVYLKPGGCTFTAVIPKDNDTTSGMSLFKGQTILNDPDSKINWRPSGDSIGKIVYNGDTMSIISDSFTYSNGDQFTPDLSITGNVVLSINNMSYIKTSELQGFILFDKYKGCCSMHPNTAAKCIYTCFPMSSVHFAVFGLINHRFYAGVTAATPKTGENYTVTLFETDPVQFKAQLNNLTK